MATVLESSPVTQGALLLGGVAFLVYFGLRALTSTGADHGEHAVAAPGAIARNTAAVSLLNPHAVLDTVGVIGTAIAAQEAVAQSAFAGGALTASWLWFLGLALGAAAMRRHLSLGMRLGVERASGVVMLGLAVFFARDLLHVAV